jgi:hypothetical protein
MTERARRDNPTVDMFRDMDCPEPPPTSEETAEGILLNLADYIYTHTPLKPMSKTLFCVSRLLLTAALHPESVHENSVVQQYEHCRRRLGTSAPRDDFEFAAVIDECGGHLPYVLRCVRATHRAAGTEDCLGLAFNSLLRGKWEAGEGLGTYLTPEEVVVPMVRMAVGAIPPEEFARLGEGEDGFLYGDICGGTGRFVFWLYEVLRAAGVSPQKLARAARLFDQSSLTVDFARINFAIAGVRPSFDQVGDSLLAVEVSECSGRFLLLATNPPFGSRKYLWNPDLASVIPGSVLNVLGVKAEGDSADPAELFVFRNLGLLAPGGVLAVVLPDGVLHSNRFRSALLAFERESGIGLDVLALVSLPATTFSLGGTVAKTSFAIIRRAGNTQTRGTYAAVAHHVGFKKRGNRRVPDPKGNDLARIAQEFVDQKDLSVGRLTPDWHASEQLLVTKLIRDESHPENVGLGESLSDLADSVRSHSQIDVTASDCLHVSVLDVDETGLIDLGSAARNRPACRGLECRPGDILVSCINPRIWRVAVVPDVGRPWSCSPEFAVLRSKTGIDPWLLSLRLHHPAVQGAVGALSTGTSSSRQRVPRQELMQVRIPRLEVSVGSIEALKKRRSEFYMSRLREISSFDRLHSGALSFDF